MPHRCMECKNVIESGALDLASGCPVCGCKKFQYIRPKKDSKDTKKDVRKLTVAEYVAMAAAEEAKNDPPKPAVQAPEPPKAEAKPEVKPEPMPKKDDKKPDTDRVESIRILEKGLYDINLPILLNRKELVMSKEDGVYIVDLPSALKISRKKK